MAAKYWMNSNFPNTFYLIQKKEPDLSTLNLNGEQDLDRIITLTYIKLAASYITNNW